MKTFFGFIILLNIIFLLEVIFLLVTKEKGNKLTWEDIFVSVGLIGFMNVMIIVIDIISLVIWLSYLIGTLL